MQKLFNVSKLFIFIFMFCSVKSNMQIYSLEINFFCALTNVFNNKGVMNCDKIQEQKVQATIQIFKDDSDKSFVLNRTFTIPQEKRTDKSNLAVSVKIVDSRNGNKILSTENKKAENNQSELSLRRRHYFQLDIEVDEYEKDDVFQKSFYSLNGQSIDDTYQFIVDIDKMARSLNSDFIQKYLI